MSLAARLSAGLAEAGLAVTPAAEERLLAYLALLAKWNQVHNLTAVREPEQMVAQHLLDSLALLPWLGERKRLLDVGSGGGLPGIPLAIADPLLQVTLLDSSHKKAAFLRQAKTELALANLEVACERVEAWRAPRAYEVVMSRAFADLGEFAALAGHLLAPAGVMFAMKGVYPYEEIARLPAPFRLAEVVALKVPQLDAERHLVIVEKVT